MQKKVSMVMTCYNKSGYIGEMFDSILAQSWDNIELVIVNDGSTDGAREIIAQYEPKFLSRGFEVVIIDQENSGVCAAAKRGLERITGDYVCVVDSDDELHPEYVETLAGALEEDETCDIACCGFVRYTGKGADKIFSKEWLPENIAPVITAEAYLLNVAWPALWVYMLKRAYYDKCGITETYYTDTKGSHEPGFMIPMAANGGKICAVKRALYRSNRSDMENSHSVHQTIEKFRAHIDEYLLLCNKAIEALPDNVEDAARKELLHIEAEYLANYSMYFRAYNFGEKKLSMQYSAKLARAAGLILNSGKDFSGERVLGNENLLIRAIRNLAIGKKFGGTKSVDKVVCYGVSQQSATHLRLIKLLEDTPLKPSELWSANQADKLKSLDERDLALCFSAGAAEAALRQLEGIKCRVLYHNELLDWLANLIFGADD